MRITDEEFNLCHEVRLVRHVLAYPHSQLVDRCRDVVSSRGDPLEELATLPVVTQTTDDVWVS